MKATWYQFLPEQGTINVSTEDQNGDVQITCSAGAVFTAEFYLEQFTGEIDSEKLFFFWNPLETWFGRVEALSTSKVKARITVTAPATAAASLVAAAVYDSGPKVSADVARARITVV